MKKKRNEIEWLRIKVRCRKTISIERCWMGCAKWYAANFHIWSIFARYIAFIQPTTKTTNRARWFDMHTDFRHSIAPNWNSIYGHIQNIFFLAEIKLRTATTTRTSVTHNGQIIIIKKQRNSDVIRWMDEVQVMAVNTRATSLYYEIFLLY